MHQAAGLEVVEDGRVSRHRDMFPGRVATHQPDRPERRLRSTGRATGGAGSLVP
jgi:hypothetical protein